MRPQALIVGDWLPADSRVTPEEALTLVDGIRGWISGPAAPQVLREAADGRREALVPQRVEEHAGDPNTPERDIAVRNYRGERYVYRNPPEPDN